MEFTVIFVGKNYAANTDKVHLGLRHLDEARANLAEASIRDKDVKDHLDLRYDPRMEITEEEARETRLFQNKNLVEIDVISASLNKYLIFHLYKGGRDNPGKLYLGRTPSHRGVAQSRGPFKVAFP